MTAGPPLLRRQGRTCAPRPPTRSRPARIGRRGARPGGSAPATARYDPERCGATVAAEIGLAGLLIPEALGGAGGCGLREAAAAARRSSGRPSRRSRTSSSAAVATAGAARRASERLTRWPQLAAGASVAALAAPLGGTAPTHGPPSTRRGRAAGRRPGGPAHRHGQPRGARRAPCRRAARPGRRGARRVYLVEATAPGVHRTPLTSLDMTRQLCDITLDDAPAGPVAVGAAAEAAVSRGPAAGAAMLAAEQLGLAQRCLDMTVAYVKERRQFARPIGSLPGGQAPARRPVDDDHPGPRRVQVRRRLPGRRRPGRPGRGRARQVGVQRRRGDRGAGMRPAARRHRLHLGAPRAPVPQGRDRRRVGDRSRARRAVRRRRREGRGRRRPRPGGRDRRRDRPRQRDRDRLRRRRSGARQRRDRRGGAARSGPSTSSARTPASRSARTSRHPPSGIWRSTSTSARTSSPPSGSFPAGSSAAAGTS